MVPNSTKEPMRLLQRRSFLSLVVLLLGLVFTSQAAARQDQKTTVLRAEFVGVGSTLAVVDYRITGDQRVLSTKLVDLPLEEVTVTVGDFRFDVPIDSSGDAVFVLDSAAGDIVPILKPGDIVVIMAEVRGSLRVIAKGVLKPAT